MFQRIASDPVAFLSGCLIWIPICIIVVTLVHWLIQAEVDAYSGIAGICLSIFLGVIALDPPEPWVSKAAFAFAFSAVLGFPLLKVSMQKYELNQVDVDTIDRIFAELKLRPNNAPSQLRLAKILYGKGHVGHAIAIAEGCLATLPKNLFAEDHRMVVAWKRAATNENYFRPLPCVECGALNQPGQIYCSGCGCAYLIDVVRGRWVGTSLARRMLSVWVALMATVLLIPVAASRLAPAAVVIVVPLLVLLAIGSIFLGFRRGPKS